jgi:hypothetical protein
MVTFPEISEKDLQGFRDTYGVSAFVCRYLHCAFSSDGFESLAKRAKHESQHQRKFRCAHPSCVYFTYGFATRSLLNTHNEKYHPAIAEGPSLAESLAPLLPTEEPTAPFINDQHATVHPDFLQLPGVLSAPAPVPGQPPPQAVNTPFYTSISYRSLTFSSPIYLTGSLLASDIFPYTIRMTALEV